MRVRLNHSLTQVLVADGSGWRGRPVIPLDGRYFLLRGQLSSRVVGQLDDLASRLCERIFRGGAAAAGVSGTRRDRRGGTRGPPTATTSKYVQHTYRQRNVNVSLLLSPILSTSCSNHRHYE